MFVTLITEEVLVAICAGATSVLRPQRVFFA
jgi:hypothetical protein